MYNLCKVLSNLLAYNNYNFPVEKVKRKKKKKKTNDTK